jgi:YgiT-type zinc finger domain-containing protein
MRTFGMMILKQKLNKTMQCVFCKTGQTVEDKTLITLQRGAAIIIIKEVPAEVCSNCGEAYLSARTNQKVLNLAEDAVEKGAELEIIRYPDTYKELV